MNNIDPKEVAKFDAAAARWWDKNGDLKTLHDINPLRLSFITKHVELKDKKVLDVGCGGGILTESLAQLADSTTGIDMSEAALKTAGYHAKESQLDIDYQQVTVEEFAKKNAGSFDVVTCMELLEHVPAPKSVINACSTMLKDDGIVFFSTISRNPKAYVHAILGAEYLLKMLPKGTHDYHKFIRPSELNRMAQTAGLELVDLKGMKYHLMDKTYSLSADVSINYLVCFRKK